MRLGGMVDMAELYSIGWFVECGFGLHVVPQDWGGGAERTKLRSLSNLSAPPPQSWGTSTVEGAWRVGS